MDVHMAGRLEEFCLDPIWDRVTISNISGHGARVIGGRPWRAHEPVRLADLAGDRRLDAQVIYCVALCDQQYAVGLKFESPMCARL